MAVNEREYYAMHGINIESINDGSSAWIPIKGRIATEDEKQRFNSDYILECPLPDDGQEILTTAKYINRKGKVKYCVEMDTFYKEDHGCYLDSCHELITTVVAWRPKPKPYIEDSDDCIEDPDGRDCISDLVTNGDVMKRLFPDLQLTCAEDGVFKVEQKGQCILQIDRLWWNNQYSGSFSVHNCK